MKKIVILITILSILSCNQNSNNIGTNHDWWYEIKVNGVSHKIGGTFNSCIYEEVTSSKYPNTAVYAYLGNGIHGIQAISLGSSSSDYINGEKFHIYSFTDNFTVGIRNFSLVDYGVNSSNIAILEYGGNSAIRPFLRHGFTLSPFDTIVSGNNAPLDSSYIPINITSISTLSQMSQTGGNCYNIGDPFTGNCSTTIYVLDTVISQSNDQYLYRFTRPYNIDIDFKVYNIL